MSTYKPSKNPFLESRPYVYAILWTSHNIGYVGVRYAKGCHPDEFWKRYFTSSSYVKAFRAANGEPDSIQIIETFLTKEQAIATEFDIIKTFDLHNDPKFLNKNCGGAIILGDESKAKLAKARARPEYIETMRQRMVGRVVSDETCQKISRMRRDPEIQKKTRATRLKNAAKRGGFFSTEALENMKVGNRKRSRRYDYNGESLTAREWMERYPQLELAPSVFRMRIEQFGWSVEKALTTPKRQ